MKNNASLTYAFLLIIGDFLALVAAFTTAYVLRVTLDPRPLVAPITSNQYITLFLALLPFWLIVFGLLGLYNKDTYDNRFAEAGRLLIGSFIGILLVIGYGYITATPVFPARLVTVYGLLLAYSFVLLFRTLARAVRRALFAFGIGINNVLLIGDSPATVELIHALDNTKLTGYRVVGVVSRKPNVLGIRENRVFPSLDEAVQKLRHEQIHSIIQTELYPRSERNSEILTFAQENHIAYRFVPGNSELLTGNIEVDLFQSMPLIAVHQTALIGWGRIVKRLFDLIVGTLLFVLLSPLMLLVALLILVFGRGRPLIFKQERLSRFDTKVRILKFRTMKKQYSGMSPEEAFKKMGRPELAKRYRQNGDQLDDDPRIGRLGRFLRRTSLDELPQLWNVARGDISLVGPRALVPEELDKHPKKNLILSVKSGLTGLAQISGRRDISFEERRKLDLYYVQNWSFWTDLVILAKTVSIVLFHRGAK